MLLHVYFIRALSYGHNLRHPGSGNEASYDWDFWIYFHRWCVVVHRLGWQRCREDGGFHYSCCRGRIVVAVAIVKKLQRSVGNSVSARNRIESVS